jgi:hypothetical protein
MINRAIFGVLSIVVVGFASQGCSVAAGPEESPQAASAAELGIADIAAAPETTTATGVTRWRVSKADGVFVTRGIDAKGATLLETRLQLHFTGGTATGFTLTDAASGRYVEADEQGVVANTLLGDDRTTQLMSRANIDFMAEHDAMVLHPTAQPYAMAVCAAGVILLAGGAFACGMGGPAGWAIGLSFMPGAIAGVAAGC